MLRSWRSRCAKRARGHRAGGARRILARRCSWSSSRSSPAGEEKDRAAGPGGDREAPLDRRGSWMGCCFVGPDRVSSTVGIEQVIELDGGSRSALLVAQDRTGGPPALDDGPALLVSIDLVELPGASLAWRCCSLDAARRGAPDAVHGLDRGSALASYLIDLMAHHRPGATRRVLTLCSWPRSHHRPALLVGHLVGGDRLDGDPAPLVGPDRLSATRCPCPRSASSTGAARWPRSGCCWLVGIEQVEPTSRPSLAEAWDHRAGSRARYDSC